MTQEEIIDRLREEMKKSSTAEVDWDAIAPETEIETLGFDSLSILDLIYDVQQAFGLSFEAEKLTSVKTVGDLAGFIQNELPA